MKMKNIVKQLTLLRNKNGIKKHYIIDISIK